MRKRIALAVFVVAAGAQAADKKCMKDGQDLGITGKTEKQMKRNCLSAGGDWAVPQAAAAAPPAQAPAQEPPAEQPPRSSGGGGGW